VLHMEDFYLYIICHAEKRRMEREVKELFGMADTIRVHFFHGSTKRKSFNCILMNVGLLMILIQTLFFITVLFLDQIALSPVYLLLPISSTYSCPCLYLPQPNSSLLQLLVLDRM
jgi:hypothetical protein